MPAPATTDEFLDLVRKSAVVDENRLAAYLQKLRAAGGLPAEPGKMAGFLVRDGLLTHFQAEQFLLGKWRRFTIGKYKVLERLGSGGMGSVYLCEHKFMRRRAAVKVLPTAKADDPSSLERFYREARAVAALDHPNIVRAYDIDQEDKLHFLVMEYVDGASLQEIVKKSGALSPLRAAHYIRQSALGLQHAHESAGIVHRDIKPGNILVDRGGIVKVLDMGLARFFHDEEDLLTKKYDENVLGTADYLAPEQALDSHGVDIRADIYSLGATFYFCLTARTPFNEGTVAQKLIWHQTRQPKPIRSLRPDVSEALVAVVDRMMAKDPAQRYQTPQAVADALAPFTQTPIGPPPASEMPQLSLAALGNTAPESGSTSSQAAAGSPSSRTRKAWQVPNSGGSQAPSSPPGPKKNEPSAFLSPPAAPGMADAPTSPSLTSGGAAASPNLKELTAEEEGAPWEHLAGDTKELSAHADTAPHSAQKSSPCGPRSRRSLSEPVVDRRQLWWVVGSVAAAVLVFLSLVIWWAFSTGDSPAPVTPAPRGPLVVTRSGRPNTFDTLRKALGQAQPGDRIVVLDDLDESPRLDGKLGKGVTIEAEKGKPVVWRLPKGEPLLLNVEGVRLKGFTLDGQGRLNYLATLTGTCPGLVLEDLTLQGFTDNAITVMNCAGTEGKPVELKSLKFVAVRPATHAIVFNALPRTEPKVNQYIQVSDCRFEGKFKTPIDVKPNVNANVQLPNGL